MAQSEASAATSDAPNGTLPRQRAVLLIVFLGIVSLFGDMTYEGARSITGPYLGVLGVTATTIGIVAGFGELLGYGARLVSGYLGDRTGKYWAITIAGYAFKAGKHDGALRRSGRGAPELNLKRPEQSLKLVQRAVP